MLVHVGEKPGSSSSSSHRITSPPPTVRLNTDDELPAYDSTHAPSSRRERVQHAFHLRNGSRKPWLTLHVTSRAANATQRPFVLGGEPIVGEIELQLDKAEYVQAIEVSVRRDNSELETSIDKDTGYRRDERGYRHHSSSSLDLSIPHASALPRMSFKPTSALANFRRKPNTTT
jgi:hypothetical protein